MHIRIQQRNGKKSLTTIQVGASRACVVSTAQTHALPLHEGPCVYGSKIVWGGDSRMVHGVLHWKGKMLSVSLHVQGLEKGYDYKKVLKAFKKGARPKLLPPSFRTSRLPTMPCHPLIQKEHDSLVNPYCKSVLFESTFRGLCTFATTCTSVLHTRGHAVLFNCLYCACPAAC